MSNELRSDDLSSDQDNPATQVQAVARSRTIWRGLFAAYNRYWADVDALVAAHQTPIAPLPNIDSGNHAGSKAPPPQAVPSSLDTTDAAALLQQWKKENPDWRQETEMQMERKMLQPDSLRDRPAGFTLQTLEEHPAVGEAQQRWREFLHQWQNHDPFREESRQFEIDSLRLKVGVVQNVQGSSESPEVVDEITIYDEIPIAPLGRTKLTSLSLQEWTDEELRQFFELTQGQPPTADELLALRERPAIIAKPDPDDKKNSLKLREYERLDAAPLNLARLYPTPLNLIRYYHAPSCTDAERERIVVTVAGWIAAQAKPEYVTGAKEKPFHADLLVYTIELLAALSPPKLIVQQARTRDELVIAIATTQSLGAALASTWCDRLFRATINCLSKAEGYRRKTRSATTNTKVLDAIPNKTKRTDETADLVEFQTKEEVRLRLSRYRLRLSEREFECLRLWMQGMKYREIADTLNVHIGTVKTNLHRAREKIKQLEESR